jgi:DNA mismatch repair protein MutS
VEHFFREPQLKELLEKQLSLIGDLERIISKAATGRISPREVVQLKVALTAIEPIKEAFSGVGQPFSLQRMGEQMDPCLPARDRIARKRSCPIRPHF